YLRAASLSSCHGAHRELRSFPTRRSSDLARSGSLWRFLRSLRSRGSALGAGHGWSERTVALLGVLTSFALSFLYLLPAGMLVVRSEEHTSELQSRENLVCRLLLEKKNNNI